MFKEIIWELFIFLVTMIGCMTFLYNLDKINDKIDDVLDSIYSIFKKRFLKSKPCYDLDKIKYTTILPLSPQIELHCNEYERAYIMDKELGKKLYDLDVYFESILAYKSFQSCGKFQDKIWKLFKKAYNDKLKETEAKKYKEEVLIAAKLYEEPKSFNKSENEQFEKMENEILHISQDSRISNELEKALVDICQSVKDIKDEKLVRKLHNFYLPELTQLMNKYLENKDNKNITEPCHKTIVELSKILKTFVINAESSKEVFETVTQCNTLKAMMSLDGLMPDMIQEKLNK